MLTRFVTLEVEMEGSIAQLQAAIASELSKIGEPLRWAITRIHEEERKALVEGVVTIRSSWV